MIFPLVEHDVVLTDELALAARAVEDIPAVPHTSETVIFRGRRIGLRGVSFEG